MLDIVDDGKYLILTPEFILPDNRKGFQIQVGNMILKWYVNGPITVRINEETLALLDKVNSNKPSTIIKAMDELLKRGYYV